VYPEAGAGFLPEPEKFQLGPDAYLDHLRRVRAAVKVPVIASLNGTSTSGWANTAKQMEQAGASAIELNVYAVGADPAFTSGDVESRVVELLTQVKVAVKIPIAVKLSPFYTSLSNLASRLSRAGADGLVLFNRLFQPELDPEALEMKRVLHLSDSSELPLRLRWLGVLSAQVPCSLAVSGGVHDAGDAIRALMAGAHGVQLVSALLKRGPKHLKVVREEVERWLEGHGYDSLAQLRGSMNYAACPDPSVYLRANYMLMLQSGWKED
jgi:dihydroorotate dehydrogenase (fumarate)